MFKVSFDFHRRFTGAFFHGFLTLPSFVWVRGRFIKVSSNSLLGAYRGTRGPVVRVYRGCEKIRVGVQGLGLDGDAYIPFHPCVSLCPPIHLCISPDTPIYPRIANRERNKNEKKLMIPKDLFRFRHIDRVPWHGCCFFQG